MTRHLYADIDIVVKFRTQTLLHILGMISLYVKMKMERNRYWEALEKRQNIAKALRTQALTALTSSFGLVGLVQYA